MAVDASFSNVSLLLPGYSPPNALTLNVSWYGEPTYSAPGFSAADASWFNTGAASRRRIILWN